MSPAGNCQEILLSSVEKALEELYSHVGQKRYQTCLRVIAKCLSRKPAAVTSLLAFFPLLFSDVCSQGGSQQPFPRGTWRTLGKARYWAPSYEQKGSIALTISSSELLECLEDIPVSFFQKQVCVTWWHLANRIKASTPAAAPPREV